MDARKSKPDLWKIVLLTVVGLPAALIILGALYQRAYSWIYDHEPSHRTAYALAEIQSATLSYTIDHHAFPPSSENRQLVAFLIKQEKPGDLLGQINPDFLNAQGEIVDAWGTPLRITFRNEDDVIVTSAGPDKIFGTADDITNQ